MTAPTVTTPAVLTPSEVATEIRSSLDAVSDAIQRGDIHAVRLGRKILIPRAALGAVCAEGWGRLGLTRVDGGKALARMVRQVSVNLDTSGSAGALAGLYPRGDIGTVRKHLEALTSRAPHVLPLYCELALAGLPFAVEKGTLAQDRADEIRDLVEQFRDAKH